MTKRHPLANVTKELSDVAITRGRIALVGNAAHTIVQDTFYASPLRAPKYF